MSNEIVGRHLAKLIRHTDARQAVIGAVDILRGLTFPQSRPDTGIRKRSEQNFREFVVFLSSEVSEARRQPQRVPGERVHKKPNRRIERRRDSLSLLVAACSARRASAPCVGFVCNAAATFDVFCWLQVTNNGVLDVLFESPPNGSNYIDIWALFIHAQNRFLIARAWFLPFLRLCANRNFTKNIILRLCVLIALLASS